MPSDPLVHVATGCSCCHGRCKQLAHLHPCYLLLPQMAKNDVGSLLVYDKDKVGPDGVIPKSLDACVGIITERGMYTGYTSSSLACWCRTYRVVVCRTPQMSHSAKPLRFHRCLPEQQSLSTTHGPTDNCLHVICRLPEEGDCPGFSICHDPRVPHHDPQ